jgi:hypothetical protein
MELSLNEQLEAVRPFLEEVRAEWQGNRSKDWSVLQKVSDAYEEMGAYAHGLTAGFMEIFRVEDESSVYGYRDAYRARVKLLPNSQLPYSYFVAINELQKRFALTDEDCTDWLTLTEADSRMSVRKMRMDIEKCHTENQRAAFMRKFAKVLRALTVLYQDSESIGMTQPLRAVLKAALEGLQKIEKWGD